MLELRDLTVCYGSLTIVGGVSLAVNRGEWWMIVGPNGAGKSTLIGAVAQGIPCTGTANFEGEDLARIKPRELAKKIGVLMQSHTVGYSFTVGEVVRLGRYAWSEGILGGLADEDEKKVREALALTGLSEMESQSVLTLSGGELQRTFLAQLLAQDPRLLILDEPANHLDLVYQKQVFELVAEWVKQPDRAVISVVHDLSLAKSYGTHALLMSKGKSVAQGAIGTTLASETLAEVYDMDVRSWMRSLLDQWQ